MQAASHRLMVSQLQQNHPVALRVFGLRYCSWLWAFPPLLFFLPLSVPFFSFFFFLLPLPSPFSPFGFLGLWGGSSGVVTGALSVEALIVSKETKPLRSRHTLVFTGMAALSLPGFLLPPSPFLSHFVSPLLFPFLPPVFFFLPLPFFLRSMLMPIGAARCDWA